MGWDCDVCGAGQEESHVECSKVNALRENNSLLLRQSALIEKAVALLQRIAHFTEWNPDVPEGYCEDCWHFKHKVGDCDDLKGDGR